METFSGCKSFAILAVTNFADINSNEYFCPVEYVASGESAAGGLCMENIIIEFINHHT